MRDLTLEQVREAGRTSTHQDPTWALYFADDGLITATRSLGPVAGAVHGWNLNGLHLPDDGWHHLPGCNCELCWTPAQPITRHLTLPGCDCEFCRS